jgi:hypothetical protein
VSVDEKQTDSFDMDLTVTATSGIQIPMRLVMTYPEGHGFYAAKALEAVPGQMDTIWNELIQSQDASTIKVMLDSGHVMLDDDE